MFLSFIVDILYRIFGKKSNFGLPARIRTETKTGLDRFPHTNWDTGRWSILFNVERFVCYPNALGTFFLYPPIASDYHVHDRVRVLAEVTRLARVSTLSKSVVLLLNDTSIHGADGAIRTHATYKVERISNPPQYHAMLTSAYCDVGAQEGIRTLTVSLPRDFHTTLCRHSRYITVVVWTLSSPCL